MIDVDVIITEEERRMLDKSIKNEKSWKFVSLEEIKMFEIKLDKQAEHFLTKCEN